VVTRCGRSIGRLSDGACVGEELAHEPSKKRERGEPERGGKNDDERRHAYRDSLRVRQSDARPDPKPTEEEANRIQGGHRIRHPKMGAGTVIETDGEGDERTAVVEFDERGRKNLRLQYVSLTVIGSEG